MMLFELHSVEIYCLGSGVAPQTPTPPYSIGQQRCFRVPGLGVSELHNAKNIVWVLGGALNTHTNVPHRAAKVCLDTWDWGV